MTVKIIDRYDDSQTFVNVASLYTAAFNYGLLHLTIEFKSDTMKLSALAKHIEIVEV